MAFMIWNDNLRTGIEIVDQQHRGLVDLMNQVAPALAHTKTPRVEAIEPLLKKLLDYSAEHFRTEEEIMSRLNMDARGRSHHEASHARFVADVLAMVQSAKTGQEVGGDRLLSFLASWLILHILGEDQTMARQVRALESGMDPASAYTQCRGDEHAPAPNALSQAMVDVYTLLTRQNRELWLANRNLDMSRTEVRKHNENLETMVRERTRELERLAGELRLARDAAEAGSQAKSRFLGIMSHELRTPMNAILAYSRMLLGQSLPQSQGVLVKRVVQSSDRLMDLLNSILDYARLGAGGADAVESTNIPLAPWLGELCSQGFLEAGRKGIATTILLDPKLPTCVRGDARLMRHILAQFVGNSVKFTARGSIEVRAERRGHQDRPRLLFAVLDTGIGIPPEVQARLFQPFVQADDRPERRFEGLGLGLALAREYARVLGGEVGVDSRPGAGSRFWFELDLAPGDEDNGQTGATACPLAETPRTGLSDSSRERLRQLAGYLAHCDTRAGPWMEALYPEIKAATGDWADTLSRLVAEFDYEKAQALILNMNGQREARP